MLNISVARAKCYLILQGLERTIAANLLRSENARTIDFFAPTEQDRALSRLWTDIGDSGWGLEDVDAEDLLVYQDLGDLINLFNRHRSTIRDVNADDVLIATQSILDSNVPSIRKRVMHPVRPLETNDLSTLMSVATSLPIEARSINWMPLNEGFIASQAPEMNMDVVIPRYWAEEPGIQHNLPVAEFDDTGFVGRNQERRDLRNLLESNHGVVTVVGAGGIGKTALALRVCNDILENPGSILDLERIVWITLKTRQLTSDGVQAITHAIDTTTALTDRLQLEMGIEQQVAGWDRIVAQMAANRTLLVIDNLETLGSEIRELAIEIPRDSKLLLTSRVGLGEIELRYPMPRLSTRDAAALMRNLGTTYNYDTIQTLSLENVRQYCGQLYYNPLLIKWFVQAVGRGTSPSDVIANRDLDAALRFCWENVYSRLSELSKEIISTLLAARRELSQTQLQALLGVNQIEFAQALQQLRQSNIVELNLVSDNNSMYRIGALVIDYLSSNHPPSDRVVSNTRQQLRRWQNEQDRSVEQYNTYRYARNAVRIENNDQSIAAPKLRNALNVMTSFGPESAHRLVDQAQELTPRWWEVHRVRAHICEIERRPVYEIEEAFEESIRCQDNDINRYHYAVYLKNIQEYERALEHVGAALDNASVDLVTLRSLRGLLLLRLGRPEDALENLEFAWATGGTDQANVPMQIRRVHGTQLADGYRRYAAKLINLGDTNAAKTNVLAGLETVCDTVEICDWDHKLAEMGVQLLSEIISTSEFDGDGTDEMQQIGLTFDLDESFRASCKGSRRVRLNLERFAGLRDIFVRTSKLVLNVDRSRRFVGTVKAMMNNYGFINSFDLGDVHFDRSSLARLGDWQELIIGLEVTFCVDQQDRGPHAWELEIV